MQTNVFFNNTHTHTHMLFLYNVSVTRAVIAICVTLGNFLYSETYICENESDIDTKKFKKGLLRVIILNNTL